MLSVGLLAILVASGVRDISFDGQAIHFPSALEIADGLNPLTTRPTRYFSAVYPNGLWTLQGLFISLTPWLDAGLEAGKAPASLLAVASIPLIAVALRCLRGAWTPAVVVATVLVQANPVMLLQLTSFELDGVVYSLVVTAVAGAILLPTRHRRTGLVALCSAILLLANTKITGLYWAGLIAPAVLPLAWRAGNAGQTGSWLAVLARVGWVLALAGVMVNMAAVVASLTGVVTTNRAITDVLAGVARDGNAVRIVPSTAPDLDGTSSIWEQRLIRVSIYPRMGPVIGCRRALFSAGSVQLCIDEQHP